MDAKTWNKLMVLGSKQGSIRLADFAHEAGLTEEETLAFLRQVFPQGSGLEVYHADNDCWIDVDASAVHYLLPVSPAEWKQLNKLMNQASLQTMQEPSFQSLKKKISDEGPIQAVMEMLDQLQVWDQEMSEQEQQFVKMLDDAVSQKRVLKIGTFDDKSYFVYPCKVLHLEGELSVIAEDFQDHCLMVFPLKNLKEATIIPANSAPKVSQFELEEFIACIRAMNERETRLVLKIHNTASLNLFPDHHFLGKPCMVTNGNGDLIWAAYVEPCDALFDWITSLGEHVEILDPTKFKEQFLSYCEEKLRKIA